MFSGTWNWTEIEQKQEQEMETRNGNWPQALDPVQEFSARLSAVHVRVHYAVQSRLRPPGRQ